MKHKLNLDRMRDISNHDASCNATCIIIIITLYCANYKCTMYIKLLNALNKLFQLGNIA